MSAYLLSRQSIPGLPMDDKHTRLAAAMAAHKEIERVASFCYAEADPWQALA